MTDKQLQILEAHEIHTDWRKRSDWRRTNKFWLRYSRAIALKVLHRLDELKMTQRTLAKNLNCSPQYVSKLLKGQANMTLETIALLEIILDLDLVNSSFSVAKSYNISDDSSRIVAEPNGVAIKKIWFEEEWLCGSDEKGNVYRQSLLWYPELRNASKDDRMKYRFGMEGIHWPDLDVDISFESFWYSDAIPSAIQRFFLEHKEINVAEFAKKAGLNATLLRNYINGFKTPSKEREKLILQRIKELGEEYVSVSSSGSWPVPLQSGQRNSI